MVMSGSEMNGARPVSSATARAADEEEELLRTWDAARLVERELVDRLGALVRVDVAVDDQIHLRLHHERLHRLAHRRAFGHRVVVVRGVCTQRRP